MLYLVYLICTKTEKRFKKQLLKMFSLFSCQIIYPVVVKGQDIVSLCCFNLTYIEHIFSWAL